jgi:hypothetical protein
MPRASTLDLWREAVAAARRAATISSTDPAARQEVCVSCGAVFWRTIGRRLHRCADCAAEDGARAAESMSAREGPAYEKAIRGQLAYWQREAARLGLKPPD